MSVRPFLDTNVLIYAFIAGEPRKRAAERLMALGGVISVQVLNEFVSVARRKVGKSWDEIDEALEVIRNLLAPPIPLTLALHRSAVALSRQSNVTFYDSLIIAAAIEAKCDILYSEDMQNGWSHGGVTVRNPFLSS